MGTKCRNLGTAASMRQATAICRRAGRLAETAFHRAGTTARWPVRRDGAGGHLSWRRRHDRVAFVMERCHRQRGRGRISSWRKPLFFATHGRGLAVRHSSPRSRPLKAAREPPRCGLHRAQTAHPGARKSVRTCKARMSKGRHRAPGAAGPQGTTPVNLSVHWRRPNAGRAAVSARPGLDMTGRLNARFNIFIDELAC